MIVDLVFECGVRVLSRAPISLKLSASACTSSPELTDAMVEITADTRRPCRQSAISMTMRRANQTQQAPRTGGHGEQMRRAERSVDWLRFA
jgi:hypothetical protein